MQGWVNSMYKRLFGPIGTDVELRFSKETLSKYSLQSIESARGAETIWIHGRLLPSDARVEFGAESQWAICSQSP